MPDPSLQFLLPALLFAFLLVTFSWKLFRRLVHADLQLSNESVTQGLRNVGPKYRMLLLLFILMISVYAFLPDAYVLFYPIEALDNPLVNSIGLLIIKFSIIVVVTAQALIDRELSRVVPKDSTLHLETNLPSKSIFNIGLFLMFTGIVVTLTNLVGIIAILICLFYFRSIFEARLESETCS